MQYYCYEMNNKIGNRICFVISKFRSKVHNNAAEYIHYVLKRFLLKISYTSSESRIKLSQIKLHQIYVENFYQHYQQSHNRWKGFKQSISNIALRVSVTAHKSKQNKSHSFIHPGKPEQHIDQIQ